MACAVDAVDAVGQLTSLLSPNGLVEGAPKVTESPRNKISPVGGTDVQLDFKYYNIKESARIPGKARYSCTDQ